MNVIGYKQFSSSKSMNEWWHVFVLKCFIIIEFLFNVYLWLSVEFLENSSDWGRDKPCDQRPVSVTDFVEEVNYLDLPYLSCPRIKPVSLGCQHSTSNKATQRLVLCPQVLFFCFFFSISRTWKFNLCLPIFVFFLVLLLFY